MTRIAPSILDADFSDLWEDIRQVEAVDLLHLDVMDGHFVSNISFGPPVIDSLRDRTDLYFDTHLMIERPGRFVGDFADAGADRLIVHAETADTRAVIESIRDRGLDAGIAINPETPPSTVRQHVDAVDVVLVMGVDPGFGGQDFLPETVEKIEILNEITDTEIAVDGGINQRTGGRCAAAGADTLVVGTSLFGQADVSRALRDLQQNLYE